MVGLIMCSGIMPVLHCAYVSVYQSVSSQAISLFDWLYSDVSYDTNIPLAK